MRERVQCNCQEEWNVLCQQRVLGSLHIVGQPSIPNSYWAVLFFLHFPPYVVAIFLFLAGFNVFACHLQFVKEVHKT